MEALNEDLYLEQLNGIETQIRLVRSLVMEKKSIRDSAHKTFEVGGEAVMDTDIATHTAEALSHKYNAEVYQTSLVPLGRDKLPYILVPSVVGSDSTTALDALAKARDGATGFSQVSSIDVNDISIAGTVITQSVLAGSSVHSGENIILTVSNGIAP
jgi:hypothetical protein